MKTPPTVLADPRNEHKLPETDDPPSATERVELERALLGSHVENRNVLAAFRAGWDCGVIDHADAVTFPDGRDAAHWGRVAREAARSGDPMRMWTMLLAVAEVLDPTSEGPPDDLAELRRRLDEVSG